MNRSAIERGIQIIKLDHWQEFYDLIRAEFLGCPNYVFRGQADADWRIESSLDRWERLHFESSAEVALCSLASFTVRRDFHLRAFRQATRAIAPVELPKEEEPLAWALAQHHGLRTPLLDWSLSPFVALYFAFEEEAIQEGLDLKRPQFRAVLALSTSAIADNQPVSGSNRSIPRVYSPSGPVSKRLLAQSSLFLMMPANTDLETWIVDNISSFGKVPAEQAVLQRILVPNHGRRDCLKMLNKMNINRLTLFPDLDGAARYVNDLWDIDFDSALGQFED